MIVYIPTPANPLLGRMVEVDRTPRVKPSVVRAIWRARAAVKRRYGYPETNCREWAAQDVAKMLGIDLSMVRRFCRLERGNQ